MSSLATKNRPDGPDGIEFRIYSTEKLAAVTDDDGKKRIKGIASSTVRDHHGDYMERSALLDMEKAANDNLTIFLNHNYKVPEDVFGSCEKAVIKRQNQDDGEGNSYYHILSMDIVVDEANPRAVKSFEHIQNGTKLGLSIGAMIPRDGWSYDEDKEAFIIHHVELLETSVVSIPANPKSWITNAVKALKSAQGEESEEGETPLIGRIGLSVDTSQLAAQLDAAEADLETTTEVAAEEVEETASADEPTISQEALEADPETEEMGVESVLESAVADLDEETLDPTIRLAIDGFRQILEATAAQLGAKVEELDVEKQRREDAEAQRDEALTLMATAVSQVQEVVTRIANTPAGRKTAFTAVQQDFAQMSSVYNERFQALYRQVTKGD